MAVDDTSREKGGKLSLGPANDLNGWTVDEHFRLRNRPYSMCGSGLFWSTLRP